MVSLVHVRLIICVVLFCTVCIPFIQASLWKLHAQVYGMKYSSRQCSGKDLKIFPNVTIHECQSYCNGVQFCTGFTYADNSQPTSKCSAKIGSCRTERGRGIHYYRKQDSKILADGALWSSFGRKFGYSYLSKKDCSGADIRGLTDVSLVECQEACSADISCTAFTWSPADQKCATKGGNCVQEMRTQDNDRQKFFMRENVYKQVMRETGWQLMQTPCKLIDKIDPIAEITPNMTVRQCFERCNASYWCDVFGHASDQRCILRMGSSCTAVSRYSARLNDYRYFKRPRRYKVWDRKLLEWGSGKGYLYAAGMCQDDGERLQSGRSGMTMESCRKLCDESDTCKRFFYKSSDNTCRLITRICRYSAKMIRSSFLEVKDAYLAAFTKEASYYQTVSSEFGYEIHNDDCVGIDASLEVMSFLGPLQTCLEKCDNATWCRAFTYNETQRSCTLKIECNVFNAGNQAKKKGVVSFVKRGDRMPERQIYESWGNDHKYLYLGEGGECERQNVTTIEAGITANQARSKRVPDTPYMKTVSARYLKYCDIECRYDEFCQTFSWNQTGGSCVLRRYYCKFESAAGNQATDSGVHNFEVIPEMKHKYGNTLRWSYHSGRCAEAGDLEHKSQGISACENQCGTNPMCSAFAMSPWLGCVMVIGDCKLYPNPNAFSHTVVKRDPELQRLTRYYLWGKVNGFTYKQGVCKRYLKPRSVYEYSNLKFCTNKCLYDSSCIGITFVEERSTCYIHDKKCGTFVGNSTAHNFQREWMYRDYDLKGSCSAAGRNNITRKMEGVSLEECGAMCTGRSDCYSFIYRGYLLMPGSTAYCQLSREQYCFSSASRSDPINSGTFLKRRSKRYIYTYN